MFHRFYPAVMLVCEKRQVVDLAVNVDPGSDSMDHLLHEAIPMSFVNEVASEEDIARYNLPFKREDGRFWTRDRERDCYLWGGIIGSYVRESPPKGEFHLYIRGVLLEVWLQTSQSELPSFITPDMVSWKRVSLIRPYDLGGLDRNEVVEILREALLVFGVNGSPSYSPNRSQVLILF